MAKREFLMQAHKYKPTKHDIICWFLSEKLDGMRCFWDGGITTGLYACNVPWANTAKDKHKFKATGLWTRKGKVIHAPKWWIDELPRIPLDGELFVGRGERQTTMSYCRKHTPIDSEWKQVKLYVFSAPNIYSAITDGHYYDTNCDVYIENVTNFLDMHRAIVPYAYAKPNFTTEYAFLSSISQYKSMQVHKQIKLPNDVQQANDIINSSMDTVLSLGGEGLVLRNPLAPWEHHRSHNVLKLKPYLDDEATVIGYVSGRETDRGSKLRGLMGALIVQYNDKVFELSGFTDHERRLLHNFDADYGFEYAWEHPGERMPENIYSPEFPIGTTVTFKYRELSKDGIPIEASYYRKHLEI